MANRIARSAFLVGSFGSLRGVLVDLLRQLDTSVLCFGRYEDCIWSLNDGNCSLVVVAMDSDKDDAMVLLEACKKALPSPPILVVVEQNDVGTAVAAMKAGATECLEKPVRSDRLRSALETIFSPVSYTHLRAHET